MGKRLEGIMSTIESILLSNSEEEVRWIELKGSSKGKKCILTSSSSGRIL